MVGDAGKLVAGTLVATERDLAFHPRTGARGLEPLRWRWSAVAGQQIVAGGRGLVVWARGRSHRFVGKDLAPIGHTIDRYRRHFDEFDEDAPLLATWYLEVHRRSARGVGSLDDGAVAIFEFVAWPPRYVPSQHLRLRLDEVVWWSPLRCVEGVALSTAQWAGVIGGPLGRALGDVLAATGREQFDDSAAALRRLVWLAVDPGANKGGLVDLDTLIDQPFQRAAAQPTRRGNVLLTVPTRPPRTGTRTTGAEGTRAGANGRPPMLPHGAGGTPSAHDDPDRSHGSSRVMEVPAEDPVALVELLCLAWMETATARASQSQGTAWLPAIHWPTPTVAEPLWVRMTDGRLETRTAATSSVRVQSFDLADHYLLDTAPRGWPGAALAAQTSFFEFCVGGPQRARSELVDDVHRRCLPLGAAQACLPEGPALCVELLSNGELLSRLPAANLWRGRFGLDVVSIRLTGTPDANLDVGAPVRVRVSREDAVYFFDSHVWAIEPTSRSAPAGWELLVACPGSILRYNRRNAFRVSLDPPMTTAVVLLDTGAAQDAGTVLEALLVDLSATGCAMLVDVPLSSGAVLELALPLDNGDVGIVQAIVTHSRPAHAGVRAFRLGVRFTRVEPAVAQQLEREIMARQRALLRRRRRCIGTRASHGSPH